MFTPSRRHLGYSLLGLAAASVLLGSQAPGTAAEGPYPGLPDLSVEGSSNGGWAGIVQTGMSQMTRAKQAVRIPLATAAAWNYTERNEYPPDSPVAYDALQGNVAYLVSPRGSDQNYGDMPPFTVRTVAFGTIPVQATVQISQRRDRSGAPIGIRFVNFMQKFRSGAEEYNHDTDIDDALWVTVRDLRIDGHRMPLTGTCRTADPAPLRLHGEGGGDLPNVALDFTHYYRPANGGRLTGSLDIPPFTGCTTEDDDLSALLTATVSGPGNPLTLQVSGAVCVTPKDGVTYPPAPGATTPEAANCPASLVPEDLPYPKRH